MTSSQKGKNWTIGRKSNSKSKLNLGTNFNDFNHIYNSYLCNEVLCKLGFSNCPRGQIEIQAQRGF
jgi:hypothetical protein